MKIFPVVHLPLGLHQAFTALVFYSIGYEFRHNKYSLSILPILIALWFLAILISNMDMYYISYGHYFLDVLGSLGGGVTIFFIAKWLSKYKFSRIISWLGGNSMLILCIHSVDLFCPWHKLLLSFLCINIPLWVTCLVRFVITMLVVMLLTHVRFVQSIFKTVTYTSLQSRYM